MPPPIARRRDAIELSTSPRGREALVASDTEGAQGRPPDSVGALTPPRRLRRVVEAHLGSRNVARVIYGAILALALVEALDDHPPAAGAMAATLLGSAVAVGMAEAYSEFVAADARTRRPADASRIREILSEAAAVVFGAGFPAVFFVMAGVDAISVATAFALAQWTELGLIVAYGYLGARLSGSSVAGALAWGAAVGLIGGIVVLIKALVH